MLPLHLPPVAEVPQRFTDFRRRLLQTVRKVVTRGEKKQQKKEVDRDFSRRNAAKGALRIFL
jgi:hypothetical protein